ncbi:MAG: DNA-binding transcriptional regulator [Limnobacter sp.]|nr:DNA-binding transcriptional regulator [Limnobacter sp.]
MTKKQKFKSDAFEAIYSSVEGLHKAGVVSKATLRKFQESCIETPPQFEPKQIKRIRELNNVSQPIFAKYLNTTESTVQKWESGAKHPSGMALKLLAIVKKHGLEILN